MADSPIFAAPVPLRCHEPFGNIGRAFCGAPAVAMRPLNGWHAPGYFCEKHARPDDQPIPPERVYRRVQLVAEILLAGASFQPGPAELDALSRTITAIESVGGIVNLLQVSSQIGRTPPLGPAPRGNGQTGKG